MRFWFRSNLRFKNLRHTSSWQRFKVCGDLNGLNGLTGLLLCCWNYNISLALTACNNFCLKQKRLTNKSAPNLRQMGRFAPLLFFFLRNQFGAHFVLGIFRSLALLTSLPQGMHGRLECLGSETSAAGCGDMISSDHPNPEAVNDCVCQHPLNFAA